MEDEDAEIPTHVSIARQELRDEISRAISNFEVATGYTVGEVVVETLDKQSKQTYIKVGNPPS